MTGKLAMGTYRSRSSRGVEGTIGSKNSTLGWPTRGRWLCGGSALMCNAAAPLAGMPAMRRNRGNADDRGR